MGMIDSDIQDMLNAYPELNYKKEHGNNIFSGKVKVCNVIPITNVILCESFKIRIEISEDYPLILPRVYDVGNSIDTNYIHRYSSGELCLETKICLSLFSKDHSEKEFVDHFLNNYLYSYLYYKRYGFYPFGERPHGLDGEIDYIAEYFAVSKVEAKRIIYYLISCEIKRNDICPCGSGRFVKRCHGNKMISLLNKVGKKQFKQYIFGKEIE